MLTFATLHLPIQNGGKGPAHPEPKQTVEEIQRLVASARTVGSEKDKRLDEGITQDDVDELVNEEMDSGSNYVC